uniref:(California timema) hypothetical protein n=1 Tax=Timema californicum TaxID=61474 RepID=A0A7R9PDT7_TIMCA|nr:unnamed protein product [Timema californicum]
MVTSLEGESIEEMVPKYRAVIDTVSNTLIAPQVSLNRQEISTQTSRTSPPIVHVEPISESRNLIYPERLIREPERHPLRIGQDDLNPFGRAGGGMIFDPFNPRGRGGIPNPGVWIPDTDNYFYCCYYYCCYYYCCYYYCCYYYYYYYYYYYCYFYYYYYCYFYCYYYYCYYFYCYYYCYYYYFYYYYYCCC